MIARIYNRAKHPMKIAYKNDKKLHQICHF